MYVQRTYVTLELLLVSTHVQTWKQKKTKKDLFYYDIV